MTWNPNSAFGIKFTELSKLLTILRYPWAVRWTLSDSFTIPTKGTLVGTTTSGENWSGKSWTSATSRSMSENLILNLNSGIDRIFMQTYLTAWLQRYISYTASGLFSCHRRGRRAQGNKNNPSILSKSRQKASKHLLNLIMSSSDLMLEASFVPIMIMKIIPVWSI